MTEDENKEPKDRDKNGDSKITWYVELYSQSSIEGESLDIWYIERRYLSPWIDILLFQDPR